MGLYRYIATRPANGAREHGELTADSAYHVRIALRRMGLLPTSVLEVRARAPLSSARLEPLRGALQRLGRSRRSTTLIELFEGLATLVATGTPIAAALDLLAGAGASGRTSRGAHRHVSRLCRQLSEELRGGSSLADAMAGEHGKGWFGALDVAMVRVGEHNGTLDQCLTDLATMHGQRDETRGQITSALAYPALLLVFGLGVVVFLTTTTLPKLAAVLTDAGVEVPPATRALLALGHLLTDRWYLAVLVFVAIAAATMVAMSSPRLAAMRLRIPLLGRTLLRSQLGDASRLLAALSKSGIPLTQSLDLVAPSVPNAAIRGVLFDVSRRLESGHDVGSCLRQSGILEPVFCRVLEVAQESGEMARALSTIGERYRSSARRLTDRLARVLEPTVIVLLAVLVGGVVYAAITPMLKLGQTISS